MWGVVLVNSPLFLLSWYPWGNCSESSEDSAATPALQRHLVADMFHHLMAILQLYKEDRRHAGKRGKGVNGTCCSFPNGIWYSLITWSSRGGSPLQSGALASLQIWQRWTEAWSLFPLQRGAVIKDSQEGLWVKQWCSCERFIKTIVFSSRMVTKRVKASETFRQMNTWDIHDSILRVVQQWHPLMRSRHIHPALWECMGRK